MIVALILPKLPLTAENAVGFMGGEPFQRPQPFRSHDARRHQQVNMIGHHDKGV
jgi:hypothetical protein